jgi:hypothetical protein
MSSLAKLQTMHNPESVRDLLGNDNIQMYRIPFYQRDYSWTTENTQELLDDVTDKIKSESNALLGLVVFVEETLEESNPRKRVLDVVDGQQRLTTISLLLAVIRSELNSIPHNSVPRNLAVRVFGIIEEIEKLLFRSSSSSKGIKHTLINFENDTLVHARIFSGLCCTLEDLEPLKSPLLNQDKEFLRNVIALNPNENDAKIEWLTSSRLFDMRTLRGSNTRKNFAYLVDEVRALAPATMYIEDRVDKLYKLKQTLLQHITLISYETNKYEEAFQLFETLNTRGLDVNASDLIKNHCIKIDSKNKKEIGELWQDIFGRIQTDSQHNSVYFLRVFHNSTEHFISKRQLYIAFKDLLPKGKNSSVWLRTEIKPEADRFIRICQNMANQQGANSQLKNVIFCLNCTSSTQWHTIALSSIRMLEHAKFNPPIASAIYNLLTETLKATLVMELKKVRGSVLERKLPELAQQLHNLIAANTAGLLQDIYEIQKALNAHRIKYDLNSRGIADDLNVKLFDNKEARPLLAFLRMQSQHQGSAFLDLTVEHVHPKEPRNPWPQWDTISREELTSALGNFISLEGPTNSSLNNADYAFKKSGYASVNAPDTFQATHPLHYQNIDVWTPEVVLERTKELSIQIEQALTTEGL